MAKVIEFNETARASLKEAPRIFRRHGDLDAAWIERRPPQFFGR